ncbi:uncharacterized protein TRIADDRAFT_31757 [Trichoplax adhaerens]|uniref:Very long-chain specific acyl-CoA dehydrogenase, mitochondrial n=1 Tax=Trichoplax adhaerens TaxID=10228 RepID=B3S9V0_TRIAD|nr:hypothetical protein TRIADDRAFT_31757 [Trichoplax adhaerens]EDV20536.1 hypothetical protein TRIADDRAFT_31757 [Trichoplax adhaerens]|eukprot:XP_002116962.1 hypothetical protein TRIADDRAFT_31757 [Trichoplax adhaerens]
MNKFYRSVCQCRHLPRQLLAKPLRLLSTTQNLRYKDQSDTFTRGIFSGKLKLNQLFPYPDALNDESKETLKIMLDPFEKYFSEVHDAKQNDIAETTLEKAFSVFKEIGGMGFLAPEQYGGLGLKNTQYARILEIFGKYDLSFSVTVGGHQSIGYKGLVLFGTDEQKQKYLPDLATGKKIAAFCLTEPMAGSDAASLRTKAVLDDDGKHYILNGNKIWITNGGFADIMTVFARVVRRKEDSDETTEGITAFIVERDFPGVTSGPAEKKMGLKSSNTASIYFDNVKVPVENMIGKVGEGFKVAMNILNNGRFGLIAVSSGLIRMLVSKTSEHANNRIQFNQKLIEFQVVQEKLAKMAMAHYAVESIAYILCNNMDRGITNFQLEASMSKIFATEAAWHCCDECIQVLGGNGYMRDNEIERHLRDIRVYRIFEGANDTLRVHIASDGIYSAAKNMRENQKLLNEFGSQKSVTEPHGKKLIEAVAPSLRDSAIKVTGCVEEFASAVRILLLKHGKNIGNQQFLLTRLADTAIDLYVMTAVLARATSAINQGLSTSNHEQLLATTYVTEGCSRVERNLLKVKNPENLTTYAAFTQIASEVSQDDTVVTARPLGF